MTDTTRKYFNLAQDYVMITFGLLCYAFGFTAFILPEKIVIGSVTGLSSLIHFWLGWNVAITYYVINIILLCIAFHSVGKQFVLRTVIGATIATIMIGVLQPMFSTPIIEQQTFMNVILGAVLCGFGLGIVFTHNGSTGGTDIIALVYTKYRNVSPGKVILALDVVILLSSLLVPSYVKVGDSLELMPFADKITTVVYGLILVTVCSYAIDMYISGSRQSVQLFILSKKYAEIADVITHELHRGVTVLDGKGWYTQHPTEVLLVVTRKSDLNLLLRYIKAIDSEAFLSVSSVNGVYGKGFDTIKLKKRTKS